MTQSLGRSLDQQLDKCVHFTYYPAGYTPQNLGKLGDISRCAAYSSRHIASGYLCTVQNTFTSRAQRPDHHDSAVRAEILHATAVFGRSAVDVYIYLRHTMRVYISSKAFAYSVSLLALATITTATTTTTTTTTTTQQQK